MKILDVEQNSPEWFAARAGVITASELDALVTPLWKIRTGDGVESYLSLKLAERWRGGPLASFSSGEMEQGSIREDEAIPAFQIMTDQILRRVGFITTDDGSAGCSPDGLMEVGGCEIKCPQPARHVAYLLANVVPKDYLAQVHGSMYVTGAPEWTFVSYCRRFPMLNLKVKRDQAIIDVIEAAVEQANERLDVMYERLCEMNGGPPVRQSKPAARREFELASVL